jgi:DNA-binding beta-propeller fold protein YncE
VKSRASGEAVSVVLRMRSLSLACALGLLSCAALLVCTPASALTHFKYEEALSKKLSTELEAGTAGHKFVEPFGLSFDAAGNLYVADPRGSEAKDGIVDKFDAEEGFISPQLGETALSGDERTRGIAVNEETGHIYVAGSPVVGSALAPRIYALGPAGEALSTWSGADTEAESFGEGFIFDAVDNSSSAAKGDVYVMIPSFNGHESEVDVMEPAGGDGEEAKFLRRLEVPGGFAFIPTDGLAVDQANGDVYVADAGNRVVERFSPSGAYEAAAQLSGAPNEEGQFEAFALPHAVAVDAATGDVFVIDNERSVKGIEAQVIDQFSSAGNFLGRFSETGAHEPLEEPVAIAVQQTGPEKGDLYVAENAKHAIEVFAPGEPQPPAIEGEAVTNLTETSVEFAAEIDPHEAPSEYRFEYGRCGAASSCAESPYETKLPEPDAALGFEDEKTHTTTPLEVTGLSPGSTYHMRVIAHSSHGQSIGPERVFTTKSPSGALVLPDGRAWELVSPPDKLGAVLSLPTESGVAEAALDGSAVSYRASAATEVGAEGAAGGVQVLSQRGEGGWHSRDLATPHEVASGSTPGLGPEYRFFAEDLQAAIVQPQGRFDPHVSSEASEQSPYLRALGSCSASCYRPLVTSAGPSPDVAAGTRFGEEAPCEENTAPGGVATECGPQALGTSPDASHVVLSSEAPLTAGAARKELYEWGGGKLSLVSVLPPNGEGEELPAGEGQVPALGSEFVLSEARARESARRAISADGARVFWEVGAKLYLRDTVRGQSVQLDAGEGGECLAKGECESGHGRYQVASADGSRVLFTAGRLMKGAGAGQSLYECRIVEVAGRLGCELADLTPPNGEGEKAEVLGDALGASEDNSTVYFVADGALTSGARAGKCLNSENQAQPAGSSCNLYELREGQLRLVASLSGEDAKDWTQKPEHQTARVSPDGRYLAFMSARSLTGYDNRDAVSGKPDAEVFIYDAVAGHLSCVSCEPSGARPRGVEYGKLVSGESEALPAVRGEWELSEWVAALLPHTSAVGNGEPNYQPRYLSDSGRLFFNSMDALSPQDQNGVGDVYEYEPGGMGGCAGGAPGCVGLISSGTSPEASGFLDASATGDDVFFMSAQRLSSQDVDSRKDVYDAHVCTGSSPCFTPPGEPEIPCSKSPEEATCRPPATPQPGVFGPAQSQGGGPANVPTLIKPVVIGPKGPTRAQLLAKALRQCQKRYRHAKKRRAACQRSAHKRYGPKKPVKKAKKSSKRRTGHR